MTKIGRNCKWGGATKTLNNNNYNDFDQIKNWPMALHTQKYMCM